MQLHPFMGVDIARHLTGDHHTLGHNIALHLARRANHHRDGFFFARFNIADHLAINADTFQQHQTAVNDSVFANQGVKLFGQRLEDGAFVFGKLTEHTKISNKK